MSKFIAPTVITNDQIVTLLLAAAAARAFQVAVTISGGAISPSIPNVALFVDASSAKFDPSFEAVASANNGAVMFVKFSIGQSDRYEKQEGTWVLTPKE